MNVVSSDALLAFWGSIITVILSTTGSYIISKKNIKNEKKRIDRMIKSEIEKVRIQYEYEQKRDNNNFLYRFKLEKLAELYELFGQFGRYNARLTIQIKELLYKERSEVTDEDIKSFLLKRSKIESEFFEEKIMRKITISTTYFPKIKENWENMSEFQNNVVHLYPDQILNLMEIKNPDFEVNKIPDGYTIGMYFKDLDKVRDSILKILDDTQIEIANIIIDMEKTM